MTAPDYRDGVIEMFAASEAELLERLAIAENTAATWRLIALQAIHRSCEQYREHERLRERYCRFLREQRGIVEESEAVDVEDAGKAAA